MKCDVYRSKTDPTKFVFVQAGRDPLEIVPSFIRNQLSELELVNSYVVQPMAPMLGLDAAQIINEVTKSGYFATGVKKFDEGTVVGAGLGAGLLAISLGATPVVGLALGLFAAMFANEKNKGGKK